MDANNELVKLKRKFAEDYSSKTPFQCGIIAAVQHGRLYSAHANRAEIRSYWKAQLEDLSRKYITGQQTEETFINDIENLKATMNERFPDSFNNGSLEYENGFRIAHAQKSLSICLKHMWCRGQLRYAPPVCPIDGFILRYVGCNDAWTKVNHVYEGSAPLYINYLNLVKKEMSKKGYDSMAEWELLSWEEIKSYSSIEAE